MLRDPLLNRRSAQVLRQLVPLPGRLRHRRQLRGGSRAARPGGRDRVARRRPAALALRQDRAGGLGRAGRGHGGAAQPHRGAREAAGGVLSPRIES